MNPSDSSGRVVGRDTWVIVRSTHPSKGSAQIPQELALLLGVSREEIAGAPKEERVLAFLREGPGVLRVVGARRSADLVARTEAVDKVVAWATVSRALVFNVPRGVYRHLGMRAHPLKVPGPLGTDDQMMWALPEREYDAMRRAKPVADPHVLLLHARVRGLLSLDERREKR